MLVLLVQNTSVRIEKQGVCPGWTEFLKYEHFKKQTENWNSKNKNDETSKYFEVLESLKRNDKIDGLKQYVAETVCEKMKK